MNKLFLWASASECGTLNQNIKNPKKFLINQKMKRIMDRAFAYIQMGKATKRLKKCISRIMRTFEN